MGDEEKAGEFLERSMFVMGRNAVVLLIGNDPL